MLNIHKIKQEICEIGRRIYQRGFAAANDGNISYRLGPNEVLCTPTMISKGFMKPEDLCVVDMEGKQLSGHRKRTSEIMLHLEIMKARPDVKAVVHCHPPHATAFGIAREPIPQCVLPEVEIFLGDVPIARYETPGGPEFAKTILPFVEKCNIVILANHGTVSFGETVERAYWWAEILDAYCRILMLARGLGRIHYFSEPEAQALLQLKEKWGLKDPRMELTNCDICANDVFRDSWKETGVQHQAFQPPRYCKPRSDAQPAEQSTGQSGKADGQPAQAAAATANPHSGIAGQAADPAHQLAVAQLGAAEQEALIQTITDRVMEMLAKR
jgi:L-fuculose-phosphate aldolase